MSNESLPRSHLGGLPQKKSLRCRLVSAEEAGPGRGNGNGNSSVVDRGSYRTMALEAKSLISRIARGARFLKVAPCSCSILVSLLSQVRVSPGLSRFFDKAPTRRDLYFLVDVLSCACGWCTRGQQRPQWRSAGSFRWASWKTFLLFRLSVPRPWMDESMRWAVYDKKEFVGEERAVCRCKVLQLGGALVPANRLFKIWR